MEGKTESEIGGTRAQNWGGKLHPISIPDLGDRSHWERGPHGKCRSTSL